jgi:hypothetical protein
LDNLLDQGAQLIKIKGKRGRKPKKRGRKPKDKSKLDNIERSPDEI